MKIAVTQPMEFYADQKERIQSLGEVTFYDELAKSPEEWLERCENADIICTGKFGLREKWQELHDVFVSLPFVGASFIDPKVAKKNGVIFSRSPGCNRHAVSEWIVGMMITMFRELDEYLRIKELPEHKLPKPTVGLAYKKLAVLGKGNVGSRVGKACEALDMKVTYFERGDSLLDKVKDADVVVDALSSNPSTENLLNTEFFGGIKKGAYFISVTGESIVDIDAMLKALDSGRLRAAAHDSGGIQMGDTKDAFYQRLLAHPKVYVTPHISYNTDVTHRISNDMMIDNVEAYLKSKPQNLV